jgi:hypothetical protein
MYIVRDTVNMTQKHLVSDVSLLSHFVDIIQIYTLYEKPEFNFCHVKHVFISLFSLFRPIY